MTSPLWLALATCVLVQGNVILREHHADSWAKQDYQMRRAVRAVDEYKLDDWLTDAQKAILTPLMGDSKSFKAKTMEFYALLSPEEQVKWDEKYKKQCTDWVSDVADDDAEDALEELFKSDVAAASAKWDEHVEKLPEEHREKANVWKVECTQLLTATSRRRRELDSNFADFTKWMTTEQKQELEDMKAGGKGMPELRAKTIGYFEALPSDKQASLKEEYKGKCKAYFGKIGTPEEMAELKGLYESGNKGEVAAKVDAIVSRQADDVKVVAGKMQAICTDVFSEKTKKKRDLDTKIEKHLSWLTADQKQAIRDMHASGKSKDEIRKTLLGYLNNLDEGSKKAAQEATRKECYKWLEEAASKAEIDELHKLHETDHGACKTKVREYIQRLPAATKLEVEKNLPFCEKVWYGEHDHSAHAHHGHNHRRRRHLHAVEKYLDWLSPEQKEIIKNMEKDDDDFGEVLNKVKEFFDAEGDAKKDELRAKFKTECASWVKDVATPEELAKLKELREAGDHDELKSFLRTLEEKLDDDRKHTVEHVRDVCLKLWEVPSRRRRDHHHTLDGVLEKYLSWTSDSQKLDLKMIKESGDKSAFYNKIMEFFDESKGDTRSKAIEELKSACKHYSLDFFGDAKINEVKKLKETGASYDVIVEKLKEFANELGDEQKTAKAMKLIDGCKKIFTAQPKRKRRDHHHTLEEAFGKYLSWITPDQKATLMSLEDSGDKKAIYEKVLEFFDVAEGETKKQAAEQLKGACKHYGTDLFGQEKMDELKAAKESGATNEEMKNKILALVETLDDEVKKAKAMKLVAGCDKIYAVATRKRRDHHHTLEEAFSKYLTWTTEEQKEELKELKKGDDKEAVYKKILEFFEKSSGDTRVKAREELKAACKHYATDIFGQAGVDEIKAFKETGATPDQMKEKILGMVKALTDEEKKTKGTKLVGACEKVYKDQASRNRRDHHHTLEDAFEKYLTWTTEEQKEELKTIKESGDKKNLYKKIMEFFDDATGSVKTTAIREMKGACRHYATDIFGEDKVTEIKNLKETGASIASIAEKFESFVAELAEENKGKAQAVVDGCKKIYDAAEARKKRRHIRHRRTHAKVATELMFGSKPWLSAEQLAEIQTLKRSGKEREMIEKITQFYRALNDKTMASQKVAATCRTIINEGCNKCSDNIIQATARMESEEAIRLLREYISKSSDSTVQDMEPLCVQAYKDHHIPSSRDLN